MPRKIEVPQPLDDSMSLPDAMRALGWFDASKPTINNLYSIHRHINNLLSFIDTLPASVVTIQKSIDMLSVLVIILNKHLSSMPPIIKSTTIELGVRNKIEEAIGALSFYQRGFARAASLSGDKSVR